MTFSPPVADYRFLLDHVARYAEVTATERFAAAGGELTDVILSEAARMCSEVLAPLNRAGDLTPARLENGVVRTSPGFAEGYAAIRDGGWVGMTAPAEIGGMGLPETLGSCVNEMMSGANIALQLNPMLTVGQIHALEAHASEELKSLYLPKLVSGEWSGTMNLTESQAGSDVGALTTIAVPRGDGTYALTGQKIFITWGDADFLPNICHLVLARLPDAAPGTRGISLFMVPKYLPDDAGNPGQPNALSVLSLEHKMGLHGSPTAVMQFDGATGWLVGELHQGMKAMFTMMNSARLAVGIQGIGQAEAAYQKALAYAQERKQGQTPTGEAGIIGHADVRRMLARMKAEIRAARGIALMTAAALDLAKAAVRTEGGKGVDWAARAALLTPIAKAFGTDTGIRVAEMGVQIHGGMGFIEETGAAQFSRDVRITAIYEGSNGIQAMDLVGRKLADGGAAARALLDEIAASAMQAATEFTDHASQLLGALGSFRRALERMLAAEMQDRFAGAVPWLAAFARVLGAHVHLRCAAAELRETGQKGERGKLADIYFARLLPELTGLLAEAEAGAKQLWALSAEELAQ